ncbi:chemotaxis protein CheB [Magnetospirillum gryphiswaldense]|uniref:histidine kinase n=1 Tax=Magnetospirillum gryphiswaldense TaxID=55518 RepID=A4U2G0_9PROT|nr:chemotaxis protein CheB [Magnetospirillum gryphiswaldense]AVM74124.1 Phytochrome-like protein cph1 [Magnetospirillum gryphiswaldense MSR-1]AVM78027.1 Phytochrome-like protein cph1 [Magnetospirillum gryphiswaldense]CAM77067.1 CheB methylesterase:MCP methyltransferase, CheR-type [Magnetospirillum gryphiswaldense MSR-1]
MSKRETNRKSSDRRQDGASVPFIVGIGASAGGLEALERFFEHMPPAPTGMAFVVVQHLSPDHKSLMVDLLSKRTSLPVLQVEENMRVNADTVYVLPPGKTLVIRDRHLRLAAKDQRNGIVLPIDIFLHSLALDQGGMAAAVILSGTGSDGTRGVRAIHEQGGMVVVQNPETARFDGMPRSAIDTGIVDEILPPDEIAPRLQSFVSQAATVHPAEQSQKQMQGGADEVDRIIRVLLSQTGTDFSHYRRGTLVRRIERRMHLNQVEHYTDYAVQLAASPQEAANLRKELLISVTAFFRDPIMFEDLRASVLEPLVKRTPSGASIRLWVCGCATGEEAYSLAILLAEAVSVSKKEIDIKVFATDIDRNAMDFASVGMYAESTVADVSPELLDKYFIRVGDNYKVVPQIRRMVLFAAHNVIKDPPFTKIDLVSCRNLLIYFEPELQQAVLSRLQFSLKVGGHLMLGSSETLGGMADNFDAVSGKNRIFRLTCQPPLPLSGVGTATDNVGRMLPTLVARGRASPGIAVEEATQALLRSTCPPTLLVNEAFEMVHNFGGVERFLRLPTGAISLDLLKHLPSGLSALLAATLHRVFREWQEIHLQNTVIENQAGESETIKLILQPVPSPGGLRRHVLVMFMACTPRDGDAITIDVDQAASERIRTLENELQSSRESQQTVIEELETTNEELQATNEEMLAANEELQSANEELQSVNEELYTVNAELNEKVDELTRLNSDLDTLMEATDIGIVFLDNAGLVRRFTPMAGKIINLMDRDIGRPIFNLSNNLDYPDLSDDIRLVLANSQFLEREATIADGSSTMLIRMHPYRSDQGAAAGMILTFVDVTPIKGAERRLQMYLDSLPYEMAVLEKDGQISLVNAAWRGFAAANGINPERVGVGCNYFGVCRATDGPDRALAETAEAGVRAVLEGRAPSFMLEYPCHSPNEYRWFMMNAGPTDSGGAVVSHINITDRKRGEEKLRLAASVFECSGEAILIADSDERIISVNPAFVEMTGYQPQDILGKTPRTLASGRHDHSFYHAMWDELRTRGIWRGEVWNRRRNGQVYPEWLTISAVKNQMGSILNYVAVFTDISERKAAEQRLMDINAELEQFAYVASHDLREPLRMVNSYLTLIERRLGERLDAETQEFMRFATDGAKRMDSLILHLLEYSRIGRMSSPSRLISINELLAPFMAGLMPMQDQRQGEITVSGGECSVFVHESECTRLFQNVIGNALKYCDPDQNPRITITCQNTGEFVLVAVADNGIGIAMDQQDKVFRMFQRLHPREAYGGGTGIGLAVCKKIVENHGGRMWFESRAGEGATFYFTLPTKSDE